MECINLKHYHNKQYIKKVALLEQELWNTDTTDISEYEDSIKKALKRPNYTILAMVNDINEIMGYIELDMFFSYDETYSKSPILKVCGLYVTPKHRNKGVAKNLFKEAEYLGLTFGCEKISSEYYEFNSVSKNLHERLGFVETSKIVSVIKNIEM